MRNKKKKDLKIKVSKKLTKQQFTKLLLGLETAAIIIAATSIK